MPTVLSTLRRVYNEEGEDVADVQEPKRSRTFLEQYVGDHMDMESELLLAVLEDCWECGYEAPESMTSFKVEGRSGNKKRDRTDVAAKILCLSDNEFKRLYRLDKRDFDDLLDKITPEVSSPRHTQQAQNSSGGPVLPVVKLAVTLRFLAGGSHLDIAFTYNVDANYVYPIVWQCAAAIKKTVNNVIFPFGDRPALERLADGFASIKNNGWWGTVAAGDGVVFKMVAPSGKFCNGQVTQFFSRKGFYCFGLQAFCDSNCKLLSVSSQMCSSTHDSTAYIATSVSRAIERSKQMKKDGVPDDQLPLPNDFHIVLDEGYVCDSSVLIVAPISPLTRTRSTTSCLCIDSASSEHLASLPNDGAFCGDHCELNPLISPSCSKPFANCTTSASIALDLHGAV